MMCMHHIGQNWPIEMAWSRINYSNRTPFGKKIYNISGAYACECESVYCIEDFVELVALER